jgi:hypothetical protein
MKKVRGKALALVLSLALVVSSFSTAFTSAASKHTVSGDLSDTENDEIYLVNGGADDDQLKIDDLQGWIFDGGGATLETKDHEVVDAKISAISHSSGDSLVKWDVPDEDETGDTTLTLRSKTADGHEVLNIQYQGSYTDPDDDEKEYVVKGYKKFDVYVLDKNQAVVADVTGTLEAGKKAELDDDFAQKTTSDPDSKKLQVVLAKPGTDAKATYTPVKTVPEETTETGSYFTLKVSNKNAIALSGATGGTTATDYKFKYADGTDVPATGIPVSKFTAPDYKVTLKVFDGDEDTGETVTVTYSPAAAGEPTLEEPDTVNTKAPTADFSADKTQIVLTPVAGATANTYKVGDNGTVTTFMEEQEIAVTGLTDGEQITLTGDTTGDTATDTNVYTFHAATAGTASVSADPTTYATVTISGDNVTVAAKNQQDNAGTPTDYVTATVKDTVKDKASTGNVTFTATPSEDAKDATGENQLSDDKNVTAKVKIAKEVLVKDAAYNAIDKDSGNTVLTDGDDKIKINGYEVNFDVTGTAPAVTVEDNVSVSKISGEVTSLTINDGNVSEIDLDSGDVEVNDAKAGDITTSGESAKVTVTSKATVGDVVIDDGTGEDTIRVESGSTGSLNANTVEVYADEDDATTTTGNIKAKTLTIDSEDSKVVTGALTAKDAGSVFTLSGDNVSTGDIDFDYRDASLNFDDFQGKINAPKNATKDGATIATTNEEDEVEVAGDVDINTVSIYDESKITFDGKLDVASIDGSGTLAIGAGKLYVSSDASGVILRLTDATLTNGETVFTAASDAVEEEDFEPYGFTLTKSAGSTTDTFKIADLQFAGVAVNKASASIAKDHSETFTASAYPAGTSLPEGYSITWTLDDANDSIFNLTVNADGTATVKVIGYDDEFASENKATLKAELVDEDGDVDDEYDAAEVALTALKVPATNFKSDTTGNVPLKVGQTYQFKITSLDGTAPTFGVAGNGATVQFAGATGSDYFYKVTGAKEGSYGVYVNGGGVEHRAAILVIKGVNVTTDTTAVTKAPGQTYQFKITAPSQPNFVAVGLKSVLASKSGNNYFYKVTASNVKGGHGIYVNGVRVAIFTVA